MNACCVRLIQFEKAIIHISTFKLSSIRFRHTHTHAHAHTHTIMVVEGLHIVHRLHMYINKRSYSKYVAGLHTHIFCYIYITSGCACPIVQVHAYTCLPRLLHLLSLPSLLYLPSFVWLVYFPMAIATYPQSAVHVYFLRLLCLQGLL